MLFQLTTLRISLTKLYPGTSEKCKVYGWVLKSKKVDSECTQVHYRSTAACKLVKTDGRSGAAYKRKFNITN